MGLHALGDSAWLFKASGSTPEKKLELVLRLRRMLELHPIPEIVDTVSSFDTIAVHFNPADGQTVLERLTSLHLDEASDRVADANVGAEEHREAVDRGSRVRRRGERDKYR